MVIAKGRASRRWINVFLIRLNHALKEGTESMITTLLVALGGTVAVLALSWVTSYVGFRKLALSGRHELAKQWTHGIATATGMLLALGALATAIVLVVQAVR
jgi:hypothetical protein